MAITIEPNLRSTTSAYRNLAFEDLMNVVEGIDPRKTPVYSTLSRNEAELGNTEFSWEVKDWQTIRGAHGPGSDYAVQTGEKRNVTERIRKMGNGGQIFREAFGADWIANSVPRMPGMGRGKLMSQGAMDAMTYLKEEVEAAFCSFDQAFTRNVTGSDGGLLAPIKELIDPANAYANFDSYVPGKPTDLHTAPADACVSDDLDTVFNLDLLQDIAEALFRATRGKRDYIILTGPSQRRRYTALTNPAQFANTNVATQIRVFNKDQDDERLKYSIRVIETDHATFYVVESLLIGVTGNDDTDTPTATRADRVFNERAENSLILSEGKLFKRWGVPWETVELPEDGSNNSKVVRGHLSLGLDHPAYFGFIEHSP